MPKQETPQSLPQPEYLDRSNGSGVVYGDMLVHCLAITKHAAGRELDENEISFFTTGMTNSMMVPISLGWVDEIEGKPLHKYARTQVEYPLVESYIPLYKETMAEYNRLQRKTTRAVLQNLPQKDLPLVPEEDIQDDESDALLQIGLDNEFFVLSEGESLSTLDKRDKRLEDLNSFGINLLLSRKGQITPSGRQRRVDISSASSIQDQFFRAAVHKLACYMGIMDQVLFQEKEAGRGASKTAKHPIEGDFDKKLAGEYGGEYPGIARLYEMGLEILRKNSQPGDPLVAPILEQGMLPDKRFS